MIRTMVCWLACLAAPFPLLAHGDLHGQIDEVSKAILKSPDNGALVFRRAELYRAHQEWEPAMRDYAKAEELKVDPLVVHMARGKMLFAAGKHEKACAELDFVIEKSPRHADAHATRAGARAKAGDHPGAVADYTAAIDATASPDPELYLERAAILCAATPPQLADALRGLDEGGKRLGSPVTLTLAAVDVEVRMGRFDSAVERIARARAGAARSELWHVRHAEVLELAGRQTEARAAWTQALRALESLPPRYREVQTTRDLEAKIGQHLSAKEANPLPPSQVQ